MRGFGYTEYSNGEMELFMEFQRRGLNRRLLTHWRIPLNVDVDGVEGTEIDFL